MSERERGKESAKKKASATAAHHMLKMTGRHALALCHPSSHDTLSHDTDALRMRDAAEACDRATTVGSATALATNFSSQTLSLSFPPAFLPSFLPSVPPSFHPLHSMKRSLF